MVPKEPWNELLLDPRSFTSSETLPDAAALKIYDTTLRDGEQMPGIALSPAEKYAIAREVSRLGCHILDICFPTSSPDEGELLRLACRGKHKGEIRDNLEILVMCRATPEDVDCTLEILRRAGFGPGDVTFLLFTSASGLHVKYKLGEMLLRREGLALDELYDTPLSFFHGANRKLIGEVIRYAAGRGVRSIEFGAEDASRTPIDLLSELVRTAAEAGAFRYVFADTTGSLTPEATRRYCSELTAAFPHLERACHFHDDFDLATINTITAVLNGFTTFSTTLNGLGERAGNAALHSVVASLKYLYGLEIPGFRYDLLGEVKTKVENATGIPVHPKEPVIGRNSFSHESGIHTHGVSIYRRMYEAIPYEEVGGQPRFVYGKHSGSAALLKLLREREDQVGYPVDAGLALRVLDEIKKVRRAMMAEIRPAAFVNQFYANLDRLGLSEDDVVSLAQTIASSRCSSEGAPEQKQGDRNGSKQEADDSDREDPLAARDRLAQGGAHAG